MKAADLVYEIVRDAIEFPSGFNKEGFIEGLYDDDRDFSSQISFAFNYVNLGLTRLVTNKKTMLKVIHKMADSTGYIEFKDGEIINVVSCVRPRDYKRVAFKPFGDGIVVEGKYVSRIVYIEYRPYIPHLDMDSIRKQTLNDDNEIQYEEIEINLESYGVTDEMCAYVKEYAKGGLMEYLSPELSQKHTQMAENYFSNLQTRYTNFPQKAVEDVFNGGGAF